MTRSPREEFKDATPTPLRCLEVRWPPFKIYDILVEMNERLKEIEKSVKKEKKDKELLNG